MSLLRAVSRNPTPPPKRNRKERRRVLELGNPDLGLLSQEMREGLPVTCSSPENRFYPFRVSHVVAGKQAATEGNQIMWDVCVTLKAGRRGWSVIVFDAHPVTREAGAVFEFSPFCHDLTAAIAEGPMRHGSPRIEEGFFYPSLSPSGPL